MERRRSGASPNSSTPSARETDALWAAGRSKSTNAPSLPELPLELFNTASSSSLLTRERIQGCL